MLNWAICSVSQWREAYVEATKAEVEPMIPSPQSRTVEGGCHCGAVRFRVRYEHRRVLACNCSICERLGYLHLIVKKDAFQLLTGEDHLTTYTFNTGLARHTFCKRCGVKSFYYPRSHPDGVSVNVRCLDETVHTNEFEIVPFDGKNWETNVHRIRNESRT